MQRAKSRGPRVLMVVILVGVLGYFAVHELGSGGSLAGILPPEAGSSPTQNAPGSTGGEVPDRPGNAVAMTVDYVHDGDTLFLYPDGPNELVPTTDRVKVRLLGIDTPEVGEKAECFGDEATAQLRTLLPEGSTTWVTADRGPTDKYGRSLFYLWTDDGRFVNYELVAQGAAESLNIPPNDAYYPLLRAAEAEAAASDLGLWGACG